MRENDHVTRIAMKTYSTLERQEHSHTGTAYFGLSLDTSSLRILSLSIVRSLLETWKPGRNVGV